MRSSGCARLLSQVGGGERGGGSEGGEVNGGGGETLSGEERLIGFVDHLSTEEEDGGFTDADWQRAARPPLPLLEEGNLAHLVISDCLRPFPPNALILLSLRRLHFPASLSSLSTWYGKKAAD